MSLVIIYYNTLLPENANRYNISTVPCHLQFGNYHIYDATFAPSPCSYNEKTQWCYYLMRIYPIDNKHRSLRICVKISGHSTWRFQSHHCNHPSFRLRRFVYIAIDDKVAQMWLKPIRWSLLERWHLQEIELHRLEYIPILADNSIA